MKLKRILLIISLLLLIIISFPGYIVFNRIKNDYPLREYVKERFLDSLKRDFGIYFGDNGPENKIYKDFKITISNKEILNLEKQVQDRLEIDSVIISTGKWDYVRATASFLGDTSDIKLRIRGDMPSNYNRSLFESTFRLNCETGPIWDKTKLSLIRPELEHNFFGYIYYKTFLDQQFLATDIELVRFFVNDKFMGFRFLQEGFDSELTNSRGEGLIFRFQGDCMDEFGRYNSATFPVLDLYKAKNVEKNEKLSLLYAEATQKYTAFKQGHIPIDSLVNIEEFARFMALTDVFLAHHAVICHNNKFFYSPTSRKLEPIAWDPASFIKYKVELHHVGFTNRFGEICNYPMSYPVHFWLSKSDAFLKSYVSHLKYYSSKNKLNELLDKNKDIVVTMEKDVLRQNFQKPHQIRCYLDNLNEILTDFGTTQLVDLNYYAEDGLLTGVNLSNLPIFIQKVSYKKENYDLNKIIAPGAPINLRLFLKENIEPGDKLKVEVGILNESETHKNTITVHEKMMWQ